MSAVFWVLLLGALRLQALGRLPSPIGMGVSFGILVAGTFDNLGFHLVQTSDYHGAGLPGMRLRIGSISPLR